MIIAVARTLRFNLKPIKDNSMTKKDSQIMVPDEVIMNKIYLIREKK